MKRPKFAVRFSCEHVEAGKPALFEVGAITGARVDLHRCCTRPECVARVVDAMGRYTVASTVGAALTRDQAAPMPSRLEGWRNRLIAWALRLLALVALGGCSMISGFDAYTFEASDGGALDVTTTPEPDASADAGTDAAQLLEAGALDVTTTPEPDASADAGTDAATFDPDSPDCCGDGCSACPGPANARRCPAGDGWICAVACACVGDS